MPDTVDRAQGEKGKQQRGERRKEEKKERGKEKKIAEADQVDALSASLLLVLQTGLNGGTTGAITLQVQ